MHVSPLTTTVCTHPIDREMWEKVRRLSCEQVTALLRHEPRQPVSPWACNRSCWCRPRSSCTRWQLTRLVRDVRPHLRLLPSGARQDTCYNSAVQREVEPCGFPT